MRGRKTKPTHLKVVEGNPGKRALNKKEPKPVGDLHAAPDWMTESQQTGWAYAIANSPQGLLKRLDRGALVVWVVAEDLHRQASEKVAKLGPLVKVGDKPKKNGKPGEKETTGGTIVQSPYVAIMNRQALIMLKAASELGFTPASRSRIQIDYGEPDTGETAKEEFWG